MRDSLSNDRTTKLTAKFFASDLRALLKNLKEGTADGHKDSKKEEFPFIDVFSPQREMIGYVRGSTKETTITIEISLTDQKGKDVIYTTASGFISVEKSSVSQQYDESRGDDTIKGLWLKKKEELSLNVYPLDPYTTSDLVRWLNLYEKNIFIQAIPSTWCFFLGAEDTYSINNLSAARCAMMFAFHENFRISGSHAEARAFVPGLFALYWYGQERAHLGPNLWTDNTKRGDRTKEYLRSLKKDVIRMASSCPVINDK